MLITILTFLIILSVLVLVHELGHFIVAKLFKIKVEEFGFGIPPRAFGIKVGETVYSINWLPIGGFVKLYGEDEAGGGKITTLKFSNAYQVGENINSEKSSKQKGENYDIDRAFFSRPIWQRASIIVAGVVMNFLLAVVIISFLFSAVGVPTHGDKVTVAEVVKNSPADKAGLKVGDRINFINDQKIVSASELVDYTKVHLGEKLKVKVTHDSKLKTLEITPRKTYPKNEGAMGIAISQNIIKQKYPWYQAPFVGTKEALKESWMVISGLGTLVSQLVTKGSLPQDVAGPIGIAQITGKVVDLGPFAVLSFVSLLSLNLAIVNILPIPGLDGGRLFFIIIEAVTRKKVHPVYEGYAHTIGMAFLLILIALITIHDLIRIFTGQPIIPK